MAQTQISTIDEALAELGVTEQTLSETEKKDLDERGFTVIREALSQRQVTALLESFERLFAQEKDGNAGTGKRERGTRHIDDLVNKDLLYQCVYTHPKLLAAARQVLSGEFRLGTLAGRDPLPGNGLQVIHADWQDRQPGEPNYVLNSLWLLDDFTAENGATRFLPGTHRLYGMAAQALRRQIANPGRIHPDEVLVVAPAGSVVIFNAHTFHSGRLNNSQESRRALQCSVSITSQLTRHHNPQILEQLSPAVRYLLGEFA